MHPVGQQVVTDVKVSVVVPVYNPGEFIAACADSLLDQTLPTAEYEVIFVDDGSTDQTAAYLDDLAERYAFVTVIHQANSGWPGQPRNLGTDRARGEYVFYGDHDDWFARDSLERLWTYAHRHGSDVVLGKMAGINRTVPRDVFRTSRPRATLSDTPLMDSLTPHKLFRREFLLAHDIRFPEGRRRLEDHYFVVLAYLCAEVISVYADSTCYFHIRRADSGNAGYQPIRWGDYFQNLSEAVDLILERVEPGALRNRILSRWLRVEMVDRLSGARFLKLAPEEADDLIRSAHRLVSGSFGPEPADLLSPLAARTARALLAGDADGIRRLAVESSRWTVRAEALQASWRGSALELTGTAELVDDREPAAEAAARFQQMIDVPLPDRPTVSFDLSERTRGVRWTVPTNCHGTGLESTFTVTIDPNTVAGGGPLPIGLWDFHVSYTVLGLRQRRRLAMADERRDQQPSLPAEPGASGSLTALYLAGPGKGVSLDVGLNKHPRLRPEAPRPAPPEAPTPAPDRPVAPAERPTAPSVRSVIKEVLPIPVRRRLRRLHRSSRRWARRTRRGLRQHWQERTAGPPNPGPQPRLSVVVLVERPDDTVAECLRSIPSEPVTEILLVGAAGRFSRNPSRELRRLAVADPRIRVLETRSHTSGAALNAAWSLARGEFLVFLRDTQLVPPRAFSRQVAALQSSGSDFAVGAMDHVREGRPRRAALAQALHRRDRLGVALRDEPDMLIDVELGNVMFRTDFWRSHPGFDPALSRPEQPAMVAAYLLARSFDVLAITTGRNRLRPNLTSIVQERSDTVEVRAARRAATTSWSLLAGADPQARAAWLAGVLDGQLGGYLDQASLGDDTFRQALAEFIGDVAAVASDPVDSAAWTHVRMHRRVQLWLAEQSRWHEIEELVEWVRLFGAVPPTHLSGNRVLGDFPISQTWNLPDDLRELAAIETYFDGAVQQVRWTQDGLLLIRGWVLIRGIALDRYPLRLEADLLEAETGQVLGLSPVLEHSDAANRWARQRYADVAPGGFVLLIDPADLPVSAGPVRTTHWQLRLKLRVGDLERSGPLTTAVRDGVDLNIPAQDLSEDLSRGGPPYRIVPMRTPALGFCLQRRRERFHVVALAVADPSASGTIAVLDQQSAAPVRIRAFLDGGRAADLSADLVPNSDGRLDFELTLPADVPAGRWDIRVLNKAGQQSWLPWGNDAELGHRLSDPPGTLAWQRTTRGFTTLITDAAQVEARLASISEQQLELEIRAFGISPAELETAVLRGRQSSVPVSSVVALTRQLDPREGASDWLLTFSTHARRWGGPELPLVSGDYTVVLPQRDLQLVPAASLLGRLPTTGSTKIHGWTMLRDPDRHAFVLRFQPPLTEEERSLNGRTQIRDRWLNSDFTPRNAVLFQSFRGEFATDSQLALHQELRRRGTDLELIWAVKDHAVALPEGAVPVIIDSTDWYTAVGSARYLCQNIDYDRWFVRRAHQRYLQTFHGYPFKSMGASLWRSQGKSERVIADGCRRRTDAWDAILVPDQQTTGLYRREYRYQGEVLVCGYPRDDSLLAAEADEVRQRTRTLLGLTPGQRAVLYAPTWRDTAATGAWTAQMFDELDLDELTKALGPDYVVLVRGHNYVHRDGGSNLAADVLDVTSYPEVNDLILAADVAVLDYSSMRFDWMLTEKPVMFFVPDLADYLSARTSLFDFASTAPGPWLSTTAEVTRALQSLDQVDARYAAARKAFNRRFQPLNDGQAAARVVDQFFS